MNLLAVIIEIMRGITFYIVVATAMIICWNIIAYMFDFRLRSGKAFFISLAVLIAIIMLDNMIYSTYHVHVFNTKIALGAMPDPIF